MVYIAKPADCEATLSGLTKQTIGHVESSLGLASSQARSVVGLKLMRSLAKQSSICSTRLVYSSTVKQCFTQCV
eukprot:5400975-Amphidinium_carterae.1